MDSQYFRFLRRQEVMRCKGFVEALTLETGKGNSSIVTRRKEDNQQSMNLSVGWSLKMEDLLFSSVPWKYGHLLKCWEEKHDKDPENREMVN